MSSSDIKPAFVIGAGGQARVLLSMLQEHYDYLYSANAIVDLDPLVRFDEEILGVSVKFDISSLSNLHKEGLHTCFIAIGDNRTRYNIYRQCVNLGYHLPNLVAPTAVVSKDASLGVGNYIAPMAHIGPMAVLGDNNIVNTAANIEHEVRLGSHSHIAPGAVVCGRSVIKEGAMIGANAVVLEKLSLGSYVTVGAGSVVTRTNIGDNMVLKGIPAKEKIGK